MKEDFKDPQNVQVSLRERCFGNWRPETTLCQGDIMPRTSGCFLALSFELWNLHPLSGSPRSRLRSESPVTVEQNQPGQSESLAYRGHVSGCVNSAPAMQNTIVRHPEAVSGLPVRLRLRPGRVGQPGCRDSDHDRWHRCAARRSYWPECQRATAGIWGVASTVTGPVSAGETRMNGPPLTAAAGPGGARSRPAGRGAAN